MNEDFVEKFQEMIDVYSELKAENDAVRDKEIEEWNKFWESTKWIIIDEE